MGYFGHKNSTCSKPWIHSKDFFEILHNEKGEEEYGTYFNGFPEEKKISIRANGLFWPENDM